MLTRATQIFAGIAGAAGVGLAAAATHAGNPELLNPAALVALTQAAVLLLLSTRKPGFLRVLAILCGVSGVILFCGTMATLAFLGWRLFPMSAPAGGILLMIGWLMAGLAFAFSPRGRAERE
jgi:uncharacterized membrane protein YgdD (TMEM256/DUF423 family)